MTTTVKKDVTKDERKEKSPNPNIVTKERLLGDTGRWRRFGEPVPAGQSLLEDGTPDRGMYGPDTLTWKMLLHPATSVFQFAFQQKLQLLNRPIAAGIRDTDTMARKAREGTLNIFDVFDRGQRNSGIHAPMWFGDTATANRIVKHLMTFHKWVGGDIIDVGEPELGNYAANSPRESMWATITEMTSVLWLYETFAFRDGQPPHRLTDEERDRYVAEQGKYIRIFPHIEEEIPTTYQELLDLYTKYERYFAYSSTMDIYPPTGQLMRPTHEKSMLKNIHWTQFRVLKPLHVAVFKFDAAIEGAFPDWARAYVGLSREQEKKSIEALKKQLPEIKKMQEPETAAFYRRLMWGPDAVELMAAAEKVMADHSRTKEK